MTLWTPSGERPVGREEPPGGQQSSTPPPRPGPVAAEPGADPADEELQAQMAEVQRELLSVPASVVVANHCIGLFQLAALHLEQRPPNLEEAKLAIDAMAAMVDGLGSRLGEDAQALRDAVASIQLGFVQVKAAVDAGNAGAPS
ncbi:MAG TPA: hypothetical protein VM121_02495 [Acidimicrobiales bacterium]|nr:hypothetical protein [Acidimicrobiales bacterium]